MEILSSALYLCHFATTEKHALISKNMKNQYILSGYREKTIWEKKIRTIKRIKTIQTKIEIKTISKNNNKRKRNDEAGVVTEESGDVVPRSKTSTPRYQMGHTVGK